MIRGYIKLWRAIEDWDWYNDNDVYTSFTKMLVMANWKDKEWRGTVIKRGSFVSSRANLSAKLGISTRTLRTVEDKLKSTNELIVSSTNNFTIYTIVNYDKYQSDEDGTTSELTNQSTNDRQTTDKRPTTTKEVKEVKEGKKKAETLEDYISRIKKEPVYAHINFDWELSKMRAWLADHAGRKLTKGFIRNWLNKIDPPLLDFNQTQDARCI